MGTLLTVHAKNSLILLNLAASQYPMRFSMLDSWAFMALQLLGSWMEVWVHVPWYTARAHPGSSLSSWAKLCRQLLADFGYMGRVHQEQAEPTRQTPGQLCRDPFPWFPPSLQPFAAQRLPEPSEISGSSNSQWIYFQPNSSQSWVGPKRLFFSVGNYTLQ